MNFLLFTFNLVSAIPAGTTSSGRVTIAATGTVKVTAATGSVGFVPLKVGDIVPTPKRVLQTKLSKRTVSLWNDISFSNAEVSSQTTLEQDKPNPSSPTECGPNYSPILMGLVKQVPSFCLGNAACKDSFDLNGYSVEVSAIYGRQNPQTLDAVLENRIIQSKMYESLYNATMAISVKNNTCTNEEIMYGDLSSIFVPTTFKYTRKESLPMFTQMNVFNQIDAQNSQVIYQYGITIKPVQESPSAFGGFGICGVVGGAIAGFVSIPDPVAGIAIGATASITCAGIDYLNSQ